MNTLETEGRGRFYAQTKYNVKVGGVDLGDGQQTTDALDEWTKNTLPNLLSIEDDLGTYFVYVFVVHLRMRMSSLEQGIINESSNIGYDDVEPFVNVEYRVQFGTRMIDITLSGRWICLSCNTCSSGTQLLEPPKLVACSIWRIRLDYIEF